MENKCLFIIDKRKDVYGLGVQMTGLTNSICLVLCGCIPPVMGIAVPSEASPWEAALVNPSPRRPRTERVLSEGCQTQRKGERKDLS